MNSEIVEGTVVIVSTGQAGTYICYGKDQACVLLSNGDLWYGHTGQMRVPQGQEDLDAAVVDYDRFANR